MKPQPSTKGAAPKPESIPSLDQIPMQQAPTMDNFRAAFYDLQRQQGNIFDEMCREVTRVNGILLQKAAGSPAPAPKG